MKKVSKFSLIALLITLAMIANTPNASACSCVGGLPLIHDIAESAAIFSGQVTQITPVAPPSIMDDLGSNFRVMQATVDVEQVWKGARSETLLVGNAICGYSFEVDKEYLIFAIELDGQLFTSMCSRTQPLDTAGEMIARLNTIYSQLPVVRFEPAATVTATGQGRSWTTADQIEVHLPFGEEQQGRTPTEQERQQLVDLLMAHGVAEGMLYSGPYYNGEDGFSFVVDLEEYWNEVEVNTVLKLLGEVETALQEESVLGIDSVEVRFSLQDCTDAAAGARSFALADARRRAELLVAPAGGERGAIVAIEEASSDPSSDDIWGLCTGIPDEWHPIPLDADLSTLQQIALQAALTVTFSVEDMQALTSPATVNSSAPVSPLPTPTGQP